MTHATRCLCVLSLLVVLGPSLAFGAEADKATEVFDSVYGSDLKRAKATRDAADDLELATRLLAAANDATRQPEFLTVLCEKAFELASAHPAGYPTAIKAMETLVTEVPAKVTWCTEQVVQIRQKQFTAARGSDRVKAGEELIAALLALVDLRADAGAPIEAATLCRRAEKVARAVKSHRLTEIDGRQKALASGLRAAREIENLKALLERNPQNRQAREKLVRAYLVDLDNPAEAARYVEGVAEASLRKHVPAAAKGVEAAPELAAKELGDWYRTLADGAPTAAKAAMLERAKAYYERFLALHTAEDLGRTAATLVLKKVEVELAQMEKGLGKPGSGWSLKTITLSLAEGVEMKFVLIPAGVFLMGSPKSERDRAGEEGPQHLVRISKPFYMGVTEVTQQQYAAVMGKNPSKLKGDKNPVEQVSWNDAVGFCKRLSAGTSRPVRLPTEAEWEYACRAGMKTRFCFGDHDRQLGMYAWYASNSGNKTHPVGRKKPNLWGLHDVHGSVREWCADWFGDYPNGAVADPTGPASGKGRVLRSGSWVNGPKFCRSASRFWRPQGRMDGEIGFRVAIDSK